MRVLVTKFLAGGWCFSEAKWRGHGGAVLRQRWQQSCSIITLIRSFDPVHRSISESSVCVDDARPCQFQVLKVRHARLHADASSVGESGVVLNLILYKHCNISHPPIIKPIHRAL